ncbi:phage holin [Bacillus altitudinis]|uniref:Phage holin n=1 Tax=Bacillus safensis TaxID=561879 RepID=A0A1L6ZLJ5_BACIA|nr:MULTISPECIES: phage holin [Bacillus]MBX7001874.1 phage holin [Bacillus aerophilus]WOQ71437.1 phage holin [Bacillus stratosphericus]APT47408.1 phage holin [Bacillus safensis]MBX7013602.1 phage holin [Bacillus aerophilus]MDC7794986.1 phage holin [Bacillus altitudinis]
MKNFDKGTVIRTVLLFMALINQALIVFGKPILPISEDQVTSLAETLYLAFSMIFTLVTTLVAWFKNNYVTDKGKLQKEVLKQKGLTK